MSAIARTTVSTSPRATASSSSSSVMGAHSSRQLRFRALDCRELLLRGAGDEVVAAVEPEVREQRGEDRGGDGGGLLVDEERGDDSGTGEHEAEAGRGRPPRRPV